MSDETGLDARAALRELKEGYRRFKDGCSRASPERTEEQIKLHADGQQPFGVVLACADSRVPPQTIFDQDIGGLFVLRVAGNVADGAVLGSIQYAVEHLGTKLIVVLGHERCGAIQAALAVAAKQGSFAGPLGQLVSGIVPLVEPVYRRGRLAGLPDGDADVLDHAVRVNIKRQAQLVRDALAGLGHEKLTLDLWLKRILVVGARYDLDDGTVEFFDEPANDRPKRIGLLAESGLGVAVAADGGLFVREGQSGCDFELHDAGEGLLALKSMGGRFVGAADAVAAAAAAIGEAERFRLLDLGDRRHALQDFRGRYLGVGADGRLATAACPHEGEYFRIVEVDE